MTYITHFINYFIFVSIYPIQFCPNFTKFEWDVRFNNIDELKENYQYNIEFPYQKCQIWIVSPILITLSLSPLSFIFAQNFCLNFTKFEWDVRFNHIDEPNCQQQYQSLKCFSHTDTEISIQWTISTTGQSQQYFLLTQFSQMGWNCNSGHQILGNSDIEVKKHHILLKNHPNSQAWCSCL